MTAPTQSSYFAPRRLGHVNLWVDDIPTSERFYSEVCGLTVEFTEPELVATFLGTGHTPHDLGMIQKTNGVDRYDTEPVLRTHPSAPLQPRRITHAVLKTAKIDEMERFYTHIGGLRVVARREGVVYAGAGRAGHGHQLGADAFALRRGAARHP